MDVIEFPSINCNWSDFDQNFQNLNQKIFISIENQINSKKIKHSINHQMMLFSLFTNAKKFSLNLKHKKIKQSKAVMDVNYFNLFISH